MKPEELKQLISQWNPYCEHITLATIFAKMRFDRGKSHVLNLGAPGTGKSRSSLELINVLNLGNDIFLDNTTTDKGLFNAFLEFPESDIVLDECSTLLKNLKTQDMIKQSMEGKSLVWTKDGVTEQTEPYKGNLIINANVPISDTVVDRCLLNKSAMNKEMNLAFNELYIEGYSKPIDHAPFINYLKKVLTDDTAPELAQDELKHVLEFTQSKIKELERDTGFSRRIIQKEISYFRRAKKLFGSLNKEVLLFIERYAGMYIVNVNTPGLIESIVGSGSIEKAALVKRIAKECGYSEQYARRVVWQEIEGKRLVLTGKLISMPK